MGLSPRKPGRNSLIRGHLTCPPGGVHSIQCQSLAPLYRLQMHPWPRAEPSTEGALMPTIALVDDDHNILTSVSIALEAEGCRVMTIFRWIFGAPGIQNQSAGPCHSRYRDAALGWHGIVATPPGEVRQAGDLPNLQREGDGRAVRP